MPTTLQFRRGTSSQNDAFTGAVGEVTVDTTNDALRIHDNSTAGGFETVARQAKYADVAERYHADQVYEPGTVVSFGGVKRDNRDHRRCRQEDSGSSINRSILCHE